MVDAKQVVAGKVVQIRYPLAYVKRGDEVEIYNLNYYRIVEGGL